MVSALSFNGRFAAFCLLLVLLMLSPTTAALAQEETAGNPEAYRYYMEGLKYLNVGDVTTATKAFERSVAADPRVKESHHELAKCLAHIGASNSKIRSEFQTALNIDRNFVECRNNYGSFLKRIGEKQQAEDQFRICLRIDPKFPFAYYNLGVMLKEKGDLDGAIENFEHATRLKPNFAEAQEALGMAIFERAAQGDLSTAVEKLETAAKLVPKNPRIHCHLGQIYASRSNLDKAENEFRTALMCDPKFAIAHWELGKLRYYRGDLDRALSELKYALAVSPTYTAVNNYPNLNLVKVKTLQAQCYEHMGQPKDALEVYMELVQMQKSDALYGQKIKALQKDVKRTIASNKHKPLPYDPAEVDAFIEKGIDAYEDGDLDRSRASFERALELNPQSFRAEQQLSFVQEAQGDLNNALATAQKAMALNPDYDGTVYNLAYLLEKSNLSDEAARTYEKFRGMANAYPYDSQHITEIQQNIIREKKKEEYIRKRGF